MSERKERAIKVAILLVFLYLLAWVLSVPIDSIYSGTILAMLILIYLDGGNK